jgi:LPXTG-motif cell wall-anchored protein
MMIRRMLLLAGALVVVLAAPAYAQYNTGVTTTNNADGTKTFSSCCYQPGSVVTYSVGGVTLGTATVNADGVAMFSAPASVPAGATVMASGTATDGTTVSQTGTVAAGETPMAPPPVMGRTLPVTGSSAAVPLGLVAAGLVVAGGLVVLGARRRASADID